MTINKLPSCQLGHVYVRWSFRPNPPTLTLSSDMTKLEKEWAKTQFVKRHSSKLATLRCWVYSGVESLDACECTDSSDAELSRLA